MLSVTEVLSNIFPYNNKFFLQSLSKEWMRKKKARWELVVWGIADKAGYINYDNLMDNLTNFWSMMHLYAYTKWAWLNVLSLPDNYWPYVKWLDDFFKRYKVSTIVGEHLVRTEDYSGTFDALLKLTLPWTDKEIIVLADFKTWKYYKDFYGIENRILKRNWTPYWEEWSLKKVWVQASMYELWFMNDPLYKKYPVDKLAVIRITKMGTFFKILPRNLQPYLDYKEWKTEDKAAKLKQVGRI